MSDPLDVEIGEKPILFTGAMVRRILSDAKTQTRRVLKQQPRDPRSWSLVARPGPAGRVWIENGRDGASFSVPCPYGRAGDFLWVKETWRPRIADGGGLVPDSADVLVRYDADGAECFFDESRVPDDWRMPKAARRGNVTPLFMPRWASRITLEITSTRVERLHDITEDDALAEGVEGDDHRAPRENFAALWNLIHDGGWSTNPLVWVVEFRRVPR